MNHEHEQRHAHATSADVAHHHDTIAPGQSSRSALLRKPDHPVASGLVQRKPRDGNGVAEGAEHAVATAASSSSSPLPSTLMRQFEHALGVDLSGVRVHAGHASAEAADAVGARAYTMGNDIHFGAGHYDPLSAAGQHLLAHEVAHTIQQSGEARGMQCKLEVSSPGDRLEHEADRAADAMISGGLATVSNATGLARAVLQRQPDELDCDVGASGWAGNLARAWASDYRETSRILNEWVIDEPNELKTTVAALLQSAMDLGALSVDVLKLGEGAAQGAWGWLDDLLRLASIVPELAELKPIALEMRVMRYRPVGNLGKLIERNGLLRELRRLFYNNVTSKWARRRYWVVGEGAQGRHLHHWLFPDRWKWVPNGIRQAGFNLMEVSRELNLGLTGPLIEVNEWIFRIGVLLMSAANGWLHFTHTKKVVDEFRRDDPLGDDRSE
jgi:hypothetical protein